MTVESYGLSDDRVLEIWVDETASDPRKEWDHFSEFIFFHNRYKLGDDHPYSDMKEALESKKEGDLFFPIKGYEHSNFIISNIATDNLIFYGFR